MGQHEGNEQRSTGWGPASSRHPAPPPPVAAQASPLITDTSIGSSLRRRRGGLPLWTWIVGAIAVVGGAIGLALTAGPGDDADGRVATVADAPATSAAATLATAAPAPSTPGTTPPTETTPPATDAPSATSLPPDTAPPTTAPPTTAGEVTPADGGFVYEDRAGVTWNVEIAGVVDAPAEEAAPACLIAIGTLTPISTTGAVSSSFSAPTIALEFGGEVLDDTVNECDTTHVEEVGYGWILDASVTPGTPYPFFAEFALGGPDLRPDAILAGRLFDGSAVPVSPVFFDAPPAAVTSPGVRADVERRPVGAGPESTSTYVDFDGVTWETTVSGLVEAPARDPQDGTCLVVLGELTPRVIEGSVSDRFTTPPFSLVVDGRLVDGAAIDCDTGAAEQAGYGWRLEAEVGVDVPYPFFASFLVPPGATVVDLLIVGLPSADDAAFYEPTVLAEIPAIG